MCYPRSEQLTPVTPDGRRRLAGRILVALCANEAWAGSDPAKLVAQAYGVADAFLSHEQSEPSEKP